MVIYDPSQTTPYDIGVAEPEPEYATLTVWDPYRNGVVDRTAMWDMNDEFSLNAAVWCQEEAIFIPGATIKLSVIDPNGQEYTQDLLTNEDGMAFSIPILLNLPGTWVVSLSFAGMTV